MNVATRTQQNGAEHIENFKLIVINEFGSEIFVLTFMLIYMFKHSDSLVFRLLLWVGVCKLRNASEIATYSTSFLNGKTFFFDLSSNFIHFQSLVSDDTTPTHSSNVNDLKPVKGFFFCSFFLFSIEASAEMATN